MQLHLIDDVPFEPDLDEIAEQIRLDAYPELEGQVRDLCERSRRSARPKAVYRIVTVDECADQQVRIGGQSFRSEALAGNLRDIDRVVAYVATCGAEIAGLDLSNYDPLSEYWHSILKEGALRAVTARLYDAVEHEHGFADLSQMNPGSANYDVWPIAQQRPLFALFGGATDDIGVRLTESHLMVPDKSVSGVMFTSSSGYVNCHACDRENCPNRRAPFLGSRVPAQER